MEIVGGVAGRGFVVGGVAGMVGGEWPVGTLCEVGGVCVCVGVRVSVGVGVVGERSEGVWEVVEL